VRHLHLLKKIDANWILMPFTRKKDFNKITHHAQFNQFARVAPLMHGNIRVGCFRRLAAGDKVLIPDAPGHFREWKRLHSTAHVVALIAVGEAPDKELVESRPRDDAELAELGDSLGKAPIRHTYPHAPLDDSRKLHHL
jgi:hypothetical protein